MTKELKKAFAAAVAERRYDDVSHMLRNGVSVNDHVECERALLTHAIYHGNAELFDLAMSHHPDIEARDDTGKTPLQIALEKSNFIFADRLLAAGADINARAGNMNLTCLHLSVHHDVLGFEYARINWLLQNGARTDLVDARGYTAAKLARTFKKHWPDRAHQISVRIEHYEDYRRAMIDKLAKDIAENGTAKDIDAVKPPTFKDRKPAP